MSQIKLDPWFITGFCDGEAAFTFSRSTSGTVAVYFSVRQRKDNSSLVESIKHYFGNIGSLYIGKEALPTERSGHTKESIYYRVSRIEELTKIIEHFDKYPLQSKKIEAYNVWKDMVLYKDAHYGGTDSNVLHEFVIKLSSLNQKSRAFKKHKK